MLLDKYIKCNLSYSVSTNAGFNRSMNYSPMFFYCVTDFLSGHQSYVLSHYMEHLCQIWTTVPWNACGTSKSKVWQIDNQQRDLYVALCFTGATKNVTLNYNQIRKYGLERWRDQDRQMKGPMTPYHHKSRLFQDAYRIKDIVRLKIMYSLL